MKIVAVLAVIAIVAVSAMPLAFAGDGSSKDKPDTIFQRLADPLSEPISMEIKPLKKVDNFQEMSVQIHPAAEPGFFLIRDGKNFGS